MFYLPLIILVGLLACSTISSSQPTLVWAKSMGGIGDDRPTSIVVDGSGNIYTLGYFRTTSDFDPGPGNANLSALGNDDVFISKLDSNGNYVWAKSVGGTGIDLGRCIALDNSGNVYFTGQFRGTSDFDPGPGVYNLTSTTAGRYDIFICKLDNSGNFVWARSLGGVESNIGYSIAVDAKGNVFTTGYFNDIVDFNPGAGVYNLTAIGIKMFISKLNASGDFVWAKQFGAAEAYSIALDQDGNIYTTGRFFGTSDFDPGVGVFNLTPIGGYDAFVCKLDSSANLVWAKGMGGTGNDRGSSIAVDKAGNVFSAGAFLNTADLDPGPGVQNVTSSGSWDMFVQKLDPSGNYVCAFKVGGSANDYINSIALDEFGNVFVLGDQYSATADFDPGPGTFDLTNTGSEAAAIAQYDNNCNLLCAFMVTPGHNESFNDHHIALSGSKLFCTIDFNSTTADFDPLASIYNLPTGSHNVAVAKYDTKNCFVPLETKFLEFKVELLKKTATLKWTVSNQNSATCYQVLRSKDGVNFTKIAQIQPAESNSTQQYTYKDETPLAGTSYYKVTQINKDGADIGSKVISVENSFVSGFNIYPNPVSIGASLHLDLTTRGHSVIVEILDLAGQLIIKQAYMVNPGFTTLEVSTENISKGIYLYKIVTQEDQEVGKVIFNN